MNYLNGIYTFDSVGELREKREDREYAAYCRKPWSVIEVSLLAAFVVLGSINGLMV